jgi:hypothetical protein
MMGRRKRRTKDRAPKSIPCGGKGWRDGECEFFCRRKGAADCILRNAPRDWAFESGTSALLRVGGGRRLRQALRLRRSG